MAEVEQEASAKEASKKATSGSARESSPFTSKESERIAASEKPLPKEELVDLPQLCSEWVSRLNGYEFRLWNYEHGCSRLSLRANDCIARRPSGVLVLHDVTYVEMPLATGKVKLREGSDEEYVYVRGKLGKNFRTSNVLAMQATGKRIFLVEFGFGQWLNDYASER